MNFNRTSNNPFFSVTSAIAAVIACVIPISIADAEHETPTFNELATVPTTIFVGRVVDISARRTSTKHIITQITFEVDYLVCGEANAKNRIVFDQLGGTIDGETMSVCCQPVWNLGERYLVFAEDPSVVLSSPTLGALEGVFHVVEGSDGVSYPLAWGYRAITGIRNGYVKPSVRASNIDRGVATLYRPEVSQANPTDNSPDGSTTNTVPSTSATAWTLDEMLERIHEIRGDVVQPKLELTPCSTLPPIPERGLTLCGCGFVTLNNVFQQVPEAWTSYSYNESLMARYNHYVDVNRYIDSDGTWNAPNGVSEICGWVDSDTLESVFDATFRWSAGGRGLCVNWSGAGCDEITEGDIFLNPDKTFVYDFDDSFGTSDQWHFQKTMIHEMGHAIGYEADVCGAETYQYNRPTMMYNNQTYHVEVVPGLHRRDALLLRLLYTDQTSEESVQDIGVESFYADGSIINSTLNPTTVMQGDTFTIENAFVENMSNASVSGVRLRVYLSTNRTITESDTLIGTYTNFNTFAFDDDWQGNITRTVPYTVSPGVYYVGMMVTKNGSNYNYDDWSSNNTTWLPDQLTVTEGDGLFNDWIMIPLLATPFNALPFWIDTHGAGDDPDPPFCPGIPPMGPSVFWRFDAEDDGVLEVGVAVPAVVGEGLVGNLPITDVVAIYMLNQSGFPTEMVALSCGTNVNGPAVAQVIAGQSYQIRVGGQGTSPTAGWYEAYLRPAEPEGARPRYAIPLTESRPWSNLAMPTTPMQLPCVGGSTKGVWFKVDADVLSEIKLSTCSPDTTFPHVLSVHKADAQFTPIGCQTSSQGACPESFGAEFTWVAQANTSYYVRVAGLDGASGTFRLNYFNALAPSQNGSCQTAMPVTPGLWSFNTSGATNDIAMLCDASATTGRAAWFSVTAPEQGFFQATTCPDSGGDSQSETLVTMFVNNCSNSVASACNNLPCDGIHGGAELQVATGDTVFIRVAPTANALSNGYVAGDLLVSFNPNCVGDLNGDSSVDITDILSLITDWGPCTGCAADFDGDNTVGVADMLVLIAAWGVCN